MTTAPDPPELIALYDYLIRTGWRELDCAHFMMGLQMAIGHPEWAHALVQKCDVVYADEEIAIRHDRMGEITRKVPMTTVDPLNGGPPNG